MTEEVREALLPIAHELRDVCIHNGEEHGVAGTALYLQCEALIVHVEFRFDIDEQTIRVFDASGR